MTTGWFRLWNDMPTDPKWRVIARASGQPISLVMACGLFAMSNVSKRSVTQCDAKERGVTHNLSHEDIAAALDADEADIKAIFDAMQGRFMDGDKVKNWDKRQPKREDSSAERTKAYREKKKSERSVTQCDAPDTDSDTDIISISNEIESLTRAEMKKPAQPKPKKPAKGGKDAKAKTKPPKPPAQDDGGHKPPEQTTPPEGDEKAVVLTTVDAKPSKSHVPDKTEPPGFAEFWDGWTPHPRSKKGLRPTALARYRQALKETDHENLCRTRDEYLAECRSIDSFTKHVSAWLYQRGWESEYSAGTGKTSTGTDVANGGAANDAGRNGVDRVTATATMALADPVLRARNSKGGVE